MHLLGPGESVNEPVGESGRRSLHHRVVEIAGVHDQLLLLDGSLSWPGVALLLIQSDVGISSKKELLSLLLQFGDLFIVPGRSLQ